MPIAIQNLIILGDSLSDIGIKREAPTGLFARAAGFMRTNEVGRYSDGKNWTDFLVEWMGGESLIREDKKQTERATAVHRELSKESLILSTNVGGQLPVRYSNYAEGGAIAASDWKPKAGALTYLKSQVARYVDERRAMGNHYTGDTLHIVWIGLNDIVTAQRPEGMELGPQAAATHEPVDVPDQSTAGTGITPLTQEIKREINRIADVFGPQHEHFILVDLPAPGVSIRFQEKIADKGEWAAAEDARKVARFNELLAALTAHWPPTSWNTPKVTKEKPSFGASEVTPVGGADPTHVSRVRMADWMKVVSADPKAFNLVGLPQSHGPVRYLGAPEPMTDPGLRRALTTSDLAHPTEAVYELIGRQIVDTAMAKGYQLGKLDPGSWPGKRPFPTVPGI
ncbi:SGNH/GDSL hydrolase family protein [Nocardia sp. NPDC051030]|uniref:SGNH/GDSL hydrolase family protein n=1 Tax=Nocardia sp. NPDC051030 TaxID=3155162 RepID=UPI003439F36E